MPDQLESALVIALRDTIRWESSVINTDGTLPGALLDDGYDVNVYQTRDRQLAFRDMVNAAAVVEASVHVSDVYNYATAKPLMDGSAQRDLPAPAYALNGSNASKVRHVDNTSIPYDALRYADVDLYGRDCLVYETLARACNEAFVNSPLTQIDTAGTVISLNGSHAWSLAEGLPNRNDLSPSVQLTKSAFKLPDRNLADRDNQLAGYVARLAQVLKNPFENAMRLYVRVDGPNGRESEVYVYRETVGTQRIWVAEPALVSRERIVYDTSDSTLRWIGDDLGAVFVRQMYAMSIPGVLPDQTVNVVADIPSAKDGQYWRAKASQFEPAGERISDTDSFLQFTSSTYTAGDTQSGVTGGYMQVDAASLTVPGSVQVTLSGTISPGTYRAMLLLEPNTSVLISGGCNYSASLDDTGHGGATFQSNVLTGDVRKGVTYRVIGGDGVHYDGHSYLSGTTFTGTAVATYTPVGTLPSKVQQDHIKFKLALPTGSWRARLEYTSADDAVASFGLTSYYAPVGNRPRLVNTDVIALVSPDSGAKSAFSDYGYFDTYDTSEFEFPVYWTYGDGVPHIRTILFESVQSGVSTASYNLSATLDGVTATATVKAQNKRCDNAVFEITTTHTLSNPTVSVNWIEKDEPSSVALDRVPVKIVQAQLQSIGSYAPLPLTEDFAGWREQCLNRAVGLAKQAYAKTLRILDANGTIPSLRNADGSWDDACSEQWMSLMEVSNPRLREQVVQSNGTITTGMLSDGFHYEALGNCTVESVSYTNGDTFYCESSNGTAVCFGAQVRQIGAFKKALPGHVGRPVLVPNGIYVDDAGTARAYYDTLYAPPVLVACQPWMVKAGFYTAQPEFWVSQSI